MSTVLGYGIRVDRSGRTGACVERAGKTQWTVREATSVGAEDEFPSTCVRTMAKHPGQTTWIVPDDLVKSLLIALPPLKGKELARAVTGWVARMESKQPADLALAWRAIGAPRDAGGERRQDVCCLAAGQQDLQEQIASAAALQMQPGRMLPGFAVLDQFYRLAGPQRDELAGWALVYLGPQENVLTIASSECLLLTRMLPFDHTGQGTEQYLARLSTEIERSRFFVRQGAKSPETQKVIVCGQPALAARLVALLTAEGSVPAVHWQAEDHFRRDGTAVDPGLLLPLAAAALSLEKPAYNLLPAPRTSLLGPTVRRRALVGIGAAAVAAVPLLVVGSLVTARIQSAYLQKARQRLEVAQGEARQAAEVYRAHRLLTARQACLTWLRQERPDLQGMLLQLAALAPAPITFDDLRIWEGEDGNVRVHLSGDSGGDSSAAAQRAFLEFQQALTTSTFLRGFREPRVLELKTVNEAGREAPQTLFSMDLELAPRTVQEG